VDSADETLLLYRDAWEVSRRMLEHARKGDWDALIAAEAQRASLLEQVRNLEAREPPAPTHAQIEAELVRDILSMDEEIVSLSRGRMDEIKSTLESNGVKKKIQRTYGAGGG
jgi:flagellar protein FliT